MVAQISTTQEFKRHAKVVAAEDLPSVPQGTRGRVLYAAGLTWIRYHVLFDNGETRSSVDGSQLVALKDWTAREEDEARARAKAEATRAASAPPVPARPAPPSAPLPPPPSTADDQLAPLREWNEGVQRENAAVAAEEQGSTGGPS